MIRVAINGAAGRMGRELVLLAHEDEELELVAAIEAAGSPSIGTDAGAVAGAGELGIAVTDVLAAGADVLIDFSTPDGTAACLDACRKSGTAMVIGTTGCSAEQRDALTAASADIPILIAPNMSVGTNVVFSVAAELARLLGPEYDIEIVEAHHRFKKDAPSGTALRIAEGIAEATGRDIEKDVVYGRGPGDGPRKDGQIGIHAIRGGDVVGEHTITFATLGERVELKHVAQSRQIFARGALRAAKWLADRGPGLYSMADVLVV